MEPGFQFIPDLRDRRLGRPVCSGLRQQLNDLQSTTGQPMSNRLPETSQFSGTLEQVEKRAPVRNPAPQHLFETVKLQNAVEAAAVENDFECRAFFARQVEEVIPAMRFQQHAVARLRQKHILFAMEVHLSPADKHHGKQVVLPGPPLIIFPVHFRILDMFEIEKFRFILKIFKIMNDDFLRIAVAVSGERIRTFPASAGFCIEQG